MRVCAQGKIYICFPIGKQIYIYIYIHKEQVNAIYWESHFFYLMKKLRKRTGMEPNQISFHRRSAVKGNSVAATPPSISTPKKHGDVKGDAQICADAAVSEELLWFH